jgi:hypothetical protein
MVEEHTQWYWDLEREIAVPAAERGSSDHMLGPYATKFEAENWRARVEARNESWEEADEEWEAGPPHDDP